MQNHISDRQVAGERADDAIRSTALFLSATTVGLILLLALAAPCAGPFLLGRFRVPVVDAQLAFFAFGAIICATAAAGIVLKIFFAQHRGFLAHAITAGAALLGVAALAVVDWLQPSHRLVWAIVGFYLPGWLLPAIAIGLVLAGRRDTAASARPVVDRALIRDFWISARWFALFAALGALTLNLDYVILSRTVAGPDIAIYSVFAKLYTLVIALLGSIMSAYWPVSTELIRRGDAVGLHRLIRRALLIGAGVTLLFSAGILMFLNVLGRALSPDVPLVLPPVFVPIFAVYCLLRVWTDTFSMVIASAGRVWVQCMIVPVQAALSLGLGYWLALHYGAPGVVIGLIVSYLLTVVWALPLYVHRFVAVRPTGAGID